MAFLRAMPIRYRDAYRLHHRIQPQELGPLVEKLEDLETAFKSQQVAAQASRKHGVDGSSSGGSSKEKTKRQRTTKENKHPKTITNKHDSPTGKFCARCAKHGGAKTSHNTNDCKKWDDHGAKVSGWKKSTSDEGRHSEGSRGNSRPYQPHKYREKRDRRERQAYAQLKDLTAAVKDLQMQKQGDRRRKGRRHGRKHRESYSSFSDSD